jgi:hypothetical protein
MFCDRIRDAERGMYCSPYLDNDVLDTVSHAKALALDNTLVALTNQTLVGVDSDTNHTGLVVSQGRNLLLVRLFIAENHNQYQNKPWVPRIRSSHTNHPCRWPVGKDCQYPRESNP